MFLVLVISILRDFGAIVYCVFILLYSLYGWMCLGVSMCIMHNSFGTQSHYNILHHVLWILLLKYTSYVSKSCHFHYQPP